MNCVFKSQIKKYVKKKKSKEQENRKTKDLYVDVTWYR